MKFGLSDSEYKYILEKVVAPLNSQGAEIFCFGSRAKGTHKKFSDLDLLIRNVEKTDKMSNVVGVITENLEEENFPYKVDIVF